MGDFRQRGDVQHVESRVAERLAEEQARIGLYRTTEIFGIARRNESGVDAEALERIREQVVRAAVERARGDDVRPGAQQRHDCQMQCGLAARDGDRANAALQRADSLLEHGADGVDDRDVRRLDRLGTVGGHSDGLVPGHLATCERRRHDLSSSTSVPGSMPCDASTSSQRS